MRCNKCNKELDLTSKGKINGVDLNGNRTN